MGLGMRLLFVPNYIPSSNLLFCGYEKTYSVIHDVIYDVIYEVIIIKIQGLYRAFLRLENQVGYRVTHV